MGWRGGDRHWRRARDFWKQEELAGSAAEQGALGEIRVVAFPKTRHTWELASPEEIAPALSRLAKEGAQALIVTGGLMLRRERRRIVKLAMVQRWPVVAGGGEWAEVGALLNYSSDPLANYRRAAYYVDRILRGTRPGELPIEQPTTFEFVVNLKTAKALGLTMPPEIMVRATRVIE